MSDVVVEMTTSTLPLTTDEILKLCPRFRILLVGKSGVGKSSLINQAFNVDIAAVSHQDPGESDIDFEITSQENVHFVLHDSKGLEPGETAHLQTAKRFIKSCCDRKDIAAKLHVIWHCIEIPFAGGRAFEKGDEELLKFAKSLQVPIVVVFTKFDQLVSRIERKLNKRRPKPPAADIERVRSETAEADFTRLCVEPLKNIDEKLDYIKTSTALNYQGTLADLINCTQELVKEDLEGIAWFACAIAQRADAPLKISSSIEIGMKGYWKGLASSTNFYNVTLDRCLATIHHDITSSWNFNDPDNLPNSEDFQKKIKTLVQLVTPEADEVISWFKDLENIATLIGVGAAFSPKYAPNLATIGLSVMFVKSISGIYTKTPEALRCLMAYIINLTLVLNQLFLSTLPIKPPHPLTMEQVDMALEKYKQDKATEVHQEIREYVNQTTFSQVLQMNIAQEKVKEHIWRYCDDAV